MHVKNSAHLPLLARPGNLQQAAPTKGPATGSGAGPLPPFEPAGEASATRRLQPGVLRSSMDDALPPEKLDVPSLMKRWGTEDPQYDLDGDGTIGMNDLIALLSQISGKAESSPQDALTAAVPESILEDTDSASQPTESGALTPSSARTEEEPMSVDGLIEAWGTANKQYDSDGDGTVNMADLLSLLSQLAPPAAVAEVNETIVKDPASDAGATMAEGTASTAMPPEHPTSQPMTVESLLDSWGQDNPAYDFDGDRTIGMNDLIAMLSRLSGAPTPEEPIIASSITTSGAQPGDVTAPADGTATTTAEEPTESPVDRLLAQWGATGKNELDLDQNGNIGMGDLMQLLNMLSQRDGQSEDGMQALRGNAHDRTLAGSAANRATRVASALVGQLESNGYTDRPPTNIHELVDQLRFAPADRSAVMSNLAAHYERGLGLDFKV